VPPSSTLCKALWTIPRHTSIKWIQVPTPHPIMNLNLIKTEIHYHGGYQTSKLDGKILPYLLHHQFATLFRQLCLIHAYAEFNQDSMIKSSQCWIKSNSNFIFILQAKSGTSLRAATTVPSMENRPLSFPIRPSDVNQLGFENWVRLQRIFSTNFIF